MSQMSVDIGKVFSEMQGLEGRVTGLETSVAEIRQELRQSHSHLAGKLDDITNAVTKQAAQPAWRIGDVLGHTRDLLAIGAILSGSVIFIANALSSAPIAAIEKQLQFDAKRIERIERLFERTLEQKLAGLPK